MPPGSTNASVETHVVKFVTGTGHFTMDAPTPTKCCKRKPEIRRGKLPFRPCLRLPFMITALIRLRLGPASPQILLPIGRPGQRQARAFKPAISALHHGSGSAQIRHVAMHLGPINPGETGESGPVKGLLADLWHAAPGDLIARYAPLRVPLDLVKRPHLSFSFHPMNLFQWTSSL